MFRGGNCGNLRGSYRKWQELRGCVTAQGSRTIVDLQLAARETTEYFWIICWIIWTFPKISRIFRKIGSFFFQEIENSWHSEHVREIPTKFHQNLDKRSQFRFEKCEFWMMNLNNYSKPPKLWRVFNSIFAIWAVQKYENLVDLEKSCKMSVWLLS